MLTERNSCQMNEANSANSIKGGILKKPLKVLHLPVTIRWIMDNTIAAENSIGIETKKMLISASGVDDCSQEKISSTPYRKPCGFLKGYPRYLYELLRYFGRYTLLVLWADIIHWQYCNRLWFEERPLGNYDFWLINVLKKPFVAQFHGGDFIDFDNLMTFNPWVKKGWDEEVLRDLTDRAARTQENFIQAGAILAMGHGMLPHVKSDNKGQSILLERMMDTQVVKQRYQNFKTKDSKVKVVHAPSHPTSKGTQFILPLMEEVQAERDIDFQLIRDM